KADDRLKSIPVVVYSTSSRPEDITASYERGAASYITKPSGFRELVEIMDGFHTYWSDVVELPDGR
ncbi:MAG TPA: hypothetical protein VFH70_06950, partial [Acidimicrobiales bacterium]|nr:hypothetical protein [Acidimicrobiales bacterium]